MADTKHFTVTLAQLNPVVGDVPATPRKRAPRERGRRPDAADVVVLMNCSSRLSAGRTWC